MANWIAGATRRKGALHRNLGIPLGEKIPKARLNAAANSDNPTISKEAQLAKTLKGLSKK